VAINIALLALISPGIGAVFDEKYPLNKPFQTKNIALFGENRSLW
jgi:hypothetical protein